MRRWLMMAIGFLASAQVAYAVEALKFSAPDKRAALLIGKLFRDEFSRPGAEYELEPELAENATSAWVKISEGEPPYLFVMLGGNYCGSGGCPIFAFRQSTRGWKKIYSQFGSDGVKILETSTKGHYDLRRFAERPGTDTIETVEFIFRWDGSAYGQATTHRVH